MRSVSLQIRTDCFPDEKGTLSSFSHLFSLGDKQTEGQQCV